MADNVTADPGSGGATFKTDEDTGASAHVPVTKIELGVDNSFDGYLSTTNPMPAAGNVAHDAPDSNNPVKVGGRAVTTLPTAAATNDRVDQIMTTQGGALVAGTDGTTPRNLAVNASGQVEVDLAAQQAGNISINVAADAVGLATSANQLANGHDVTVDNAAGASAVNIQDGGNKITVDWNGTDPPIGAGTAAGALRVEIASDAASLTVDQATAANLNAQVVGTTAQGAGVSGNPVQMAVEAQNVGATPTAQDDADVIRPIATRYGQLFTLGGHPNIVTREYFKNTAQTDDPIIDTVAAGNRIVVTMISVQVDNAETTDADVRIGFGATTVPSKPASGATVDGVLISADGIAPGSGIVKGDGNGVIGIGGDGEELRFTSSSTHAVNVIVTYYVSAA